MIVNGSDVKVVEFAPRVGGGLSFRTVKINTGFDILNATVDSFLGIKPDMNYAAPRSLLSINNLYGQAGTFGSIEGGFRDLIEAGVIKEFHCYKTRGGASIGADMASNTRVGSFIIEASDENELLSKTKVAIECLQIYDTSGNEIMRKDIYLSELKGV